MAEMYDSIAQEKNLQNCFGRSPVAIVWVPRLARSFWFLGHSGGTRTNAEDGALQKPATCFYAYI